GIRCIGGIQVASQNGGVVGAGRIIPASADVGIVSAGYVLVSSAHIGIDSTRDVEPTCRDRGIRTGDRVGVSSHQPAITAVVFAISQNQVMAAGTDIKASTVEVVVADDQVAQAR